MSANNKVIMMAARRTNKNEPRVGANELNERKRKVLWAVVQDYADTAEPVGSRTIAKKYNLGVSSATIRNEMQDMKDIWNSPILRQDVSLPSRDIVFTWTGSCSRLPFPVKKNP